MQSDIKDLIKSEDYKGKFKIIKTKCMDFCKSAPLVVINNEVLKRANLPDIKKKL
mgnify:FL=1